MDTKTIRNLIVFILAVAASGWIGVGWDHLHGISAQGNSDGMGIWLVLPLLTAFILAWRSRISPSEIGLQPNLRGNLRWYLLSLLVFPLVTGMVVLIGYTTGWIDISDFNRVSFVRVFGSTLLVNFIIDIFEEGAWRGFLTSQLLKLKLPDWKLYLAAGCIWALWHVPYFLVFLPESDIRAIMPVSRGVYVLVTLATLLCWTVMFTELFRLTGSFWPCVLMHMVEDSLINHLVIDGHIHIAGGMQILVSPINGIITCALYLAIGLVLRKCRQERELPSPGCKDKQPAAFQSPVAAWPALSREK